MKFSDDSMKPSDIASADSAAEFSPAPLLNAFENYRGSFFDLDRGIKISAGDLKKLKTKLCKQMLRSGLAAGDLLITAAPNGPLFAAVWAASLEAGASPVLAHGETPTLELGRMAERWGARFVAQAEVEHNSRNRAGESLSAGEHGTVHWRRVKEREARCGQHGLCSVPLHPTSGTSCSPKIAVRPGPCAVAEPQHYIQTLSIDKSDVILCALSMSHAYAYGMCFLVALLTSADLVFMRGLNPELVREALNKRMVSVFPAVPIMLDTLLGSDAGDLTGRPRILLSAGAPLSRKTFDAFRDRYDLSIRPLYGTTETGGISIGSADDQFDGSVGTPMEGVEVDTHTSSDASFGQKTGILRVRSSSMMAGYLGGGGVSRRALSDGWFETGDLARTDAQGRIYLQGRASEVINVFGFKVLPREVEEVILLLPEVAEVKVYAARWRGQDVLEAAVVLRGRLTEETILKHCDQHLVNYKCPTAIRFLRALPRTPSGKVAVELLSGGEI
jgi:acyl-coenzyme A synthetase/AMP-(fatty) acid ligase